jgi:hypothetical protein
MSLLQMEIGVAIVTAFLVGLLGAYMLIPGKKS